MNIFIIARGYPTQQEPTWGCFEKDQAKALVKLGHRVTILSVDVRFRWHKRSLGIQHHKDSKLSAYNIFLLPYVLLFFIPQQIKDWFYTWQLERIYKRAVIEQGKPDILYTHYLYNTHKTIPLGLKYHIPIVAIEHCSLMGYHPIPKTARRLAQKTYPNVSQLLTVSSALRDNINNELGFNSIVISNIVGEEFCFRPQKKNSIIKIVSVGRLVKGKRFDLLIRAANQIDIPFEINIIGNGPELKSLQALIHGLHLQHKIHLLGSKTKEELSSILNDCDIFALPSQSETFGVSYVEAMACGLPIIATDCGGPTDFVNEQNGILIPTNDLMALRNAIEFMITNLEKYNRQAIAKDCQERFSSEIIAQRLTSIFEEITNEYKKQQ